uniref:Uncharacterized protein n=1 Tax=Anguilla anguilla TaxID=7936 RepID=A0A0E9RXX2_ANGAN
MQVERVWVCLFLKLYSRKGY